jgi:hypothetical protein
MTAPRGWGLAPWFAGRDETLAHPDDVTRLVTLRPYGRVFELVGNDAGYLILRYRDQRYRISPSLFQGVPAPAFDFDEPVIVATKPGQAAAVDGIFWHFKNRRPFYGLRFGSKVSSRRYWDDELIRRPPR